MSEHREKDIEELSSYLRQFREHDGEKPIETIFVPVAAERDSRGAVGWIEENQLALPRWTNRFKRSEEEVMDYNLLDEKWIPVLRKNGEFYHVGIIEALTDAGRIRQIAASNPMDRLAILRFLLALLYWCKGNPPHDYDSISANSFPADWFTKLYENRECFNLLGDGKRFYQDRSARRVRAITDLLQEIPAGNNFWHFRHSTDKEDGLCPACCAMGLLRLPLFSVSGLSGPGEPNLMAGINGPPPIYAVPWDKSLLKTLRTNWVKCDEIGEPSWNQSGVSHVADENIPLLTGLTLLSRRVLLHDPSEELGACIGCGASRTPIILTCQFQTAGKQENDRWRDPHVLYSEGSPREALRAGDLTKKYFQMDRPWPDLFARIATAGKPASILVVGFATNKAKNIDVWERCIELPSMDSNPEPESLAKKWKKEISNLVPKGRPKESRRKHTGILAMVATIRPHVEARVSAKVCELPLWDKATWVQATLEYGPMMDMIAKSLSPGYTTVAVKRRKQIANLLPDVLPTTKAKNPGLEKGEDK